MWPLCRMCGLPMTCFCKRLVLKRPALPAGRFLPSAPMTCLCKVLKNIPLDRHLPTRAGLRSLPMTSFCKCLYLRRPALPAGRFLPAVEMTRPMRAAGGEENRALRARFSSPHTTLHETWSFRPQGEIYSIISSPHYAQKFWVNPRNDTTYAGRGRRGIGRKAPDPPPPTTTTTTLTVSPRVVYSPPQPFGD